MSRSSSPDSLTGFVNFSKPADMTSSDAVCIVRGALSKVIGGRQKAGHLGTLDPLAEGVLPIALGRATALFDFLAFKTKTYIARFVFGSTTDTLDRGGKFSAQSGRVPTAEEIKSVLSKFTGEIMQVPPAYSAKSVEGRRAYDYARNGVEVSLPAKKVTVHSLSLTGEDEHGYIFEITCGGGTYIRALARDIAAELGTVAYMSALTRTSSGPFALADAVSVEDFRRDPAGCIIPAEYALAGLERAELDAEAERRILNGIPLKGEWQEREYAAVHGESGRLLGLGRADSRGLRLYVRL